MVEVVLLVCYREREKEKERGATTLHHSNTRIHFLLEGKGNELSRHARVEEGVLLIEPMHRDM